MMCLFQFVYEIILRVCVCVCLCVQIQHYDVPLSVCQSSYLYVQIQHQVSQCSCSKKFKVVRVAEGQYRVRQNHSCTDS